MKYLIFLFSLIALIGCGGGGVSNGWSNYDESTQLNNYNDSSKVINDNSSDPTTYTFTNVKKVHITLHLAHLKDVYVVATSHFNYNEVTIDDNIGYGINYKHNKIVQNKKATTLMTPQKVLNFRKKAFALLQKNSNKKQNYKLTPLYKNYSKGDSESFCVDMDNDNNCTKWVNATVQKIVDAFTSFGERKLIVWVEDNEYNNREITSKMVDDLANAFLQSGSNNDIYDWDTSLYGAEWGSHNKSNLIGYDGNIHILIYKMDEDRVAGYFWSKDNYTKSQVPASNEKIMFYINSTLYSGNVAGFDKEKAKKETFSTLAHEFQHMIHFYQREVLKNIDDATWFNEMLSEATEDLVATKLKYKGPRNVDPKDGSAGESGNDGGRYPYFNRYDYYSLTLWHDRDIASYGIVSSFGAFLLRNYGGAKVLHDLEKSNYADEKALESATGKSIHELLREWAVGVLLSDYISLPNGLPQYNFGDFKETSYNGNTYKLGSINFFNYVFDNDFEYLEGPYFSNHKTINKNANLYYEVGKNLSGKVTIDVSFSKGGDVTIVTK